MSTQGNHPCGPGQKSPCRGRVKAQRHDRALLRSNGLPPSKLASSAGGLRYRAVFDRRKPGFYSSCNKGTAGRTLRSQKKAHSAQRQESLPLPQATGIPDFPQRPTDGRPANRSTSRAAHTPGPPLFHSSAGSTEESGGAVCKVQVRWPPRWSAAPNPRLACSKSYRTRHIRFQGRYR